MMPAFCIGDGVPDELLAPVIKSIMDLVTASADVCLDTGAVTSILENSTAVMIGFGQANGNDRAIKAALKAIENPFGEEQLGRATDMVIHVSGSGTLTLDEINSISDYITDSVNPNANIYYGLYIDDELEDDVRVIVLAGH